MRKFTRRAALAVAVLVVASCGGDDDDDAAPEATPAASAETAASEAPTSEAPTSEAPTADAPTSEAPTSEAPAPDAPAEECTETVPEFSMGVLRPPQSLDPSFATSSGAEGGNELAAIFDVLMQYDIETGEIVPRLAESLEPNADFTEWTLTLREGMTFGSGAPLNTEAVVFSVDLHRAETSTSLNKAAAQKITEMEIVSDTEMIFKLAEPWAGFPILLGPTVGIPVDPAVYQQLGAEAFAADPQGGGAGPFVLQNWVRGEEFTVAVKEDYWGARPCVDSVRLVSITDDVTRVDAFANGEVDAVYLRGPLGHNYIESLELDAPHVSQVVNAGSVLLVNNGARGVARPGGDPRVRQAIALAIDPQVISDRVFEGGGDPSKALLSEESTRYSDGIEALPVDPVEAKRLLDEAKAETGYNGELKMPAANTPQSVNTALTIKAMLDAVGFNVLVDSSYDSSAISKLLVETADFDIMQSALSMYDPDLWGQLSRRIDCGTPTGWIGFDCAAYPEWGAAMTQLYEAETVEDQQAAMVEVSKVWNEAVPSVVLDHHQISAYYSEEFEGLDFTKDGIVLFDSVRAVG